LFNAYQFKKVADTGALPADLRQSPDDKYLYVSCFGDNSIQQLDATDPEHPSSPGQSSRTFSLEPSMPSPISEAVVRFIPPRQMSDPGR
jgi:hypothetical protein